MYDFFDVFCLFPLLLVYRIYRPFECIFLYQNIHSELEIFVLAKGAQKLYTNFCRAGGKPKKIGGYNMGKEFDELMDLARKVVEQGEESARKHPKTDEILVVIVEPGKKPYKKLIPNSLSTKQDIVGGYYENVFIGEQDGKRFGIGVNEEGKLMGLPVNRILVGFDVLVGPMFITAYNYEGDSVTLTDIEANLFVRRFTPVEVYM
jgi:hypothetical protein